MNWGEHVNGSFFPEIVFIITKFYRGFELEKQIFRLDHFYHWPDVAELFQRCSQLRYIQRYSFS